MLRDTLKSLNLYRIWWVSLRFVVRCIFLSSSVIGTELVLSLFVFFFLPYLISLQFFNCKVSTNAAALFFFIIRKLWVFWPVFRAAQWWRLYFSKWAYGFSISTGLKMSYLPLYKKDTHTFLELLITLSQNALWGKKMAGIQLIISFLFPSTYQIHPLM